MFDRTLRSTLLFAALMTLTAGSWIGPNAATAQSRSELLSESEFRIEGRSNESDWAVRSTVVSGWLELESPEDPMSVSALSLVVPAGDIKADKGLIMNRVMYSAFDLETHPNIMFDLTSVSIPDTSSEMTNLIALGTLSLNGTEQEISVPLHAQEDSNGVHRYAGSVPLTMTDYGMKPPTAMFGKLRVHKDIVVHFDLAFGSTADE